jgi:hypothetical protein
MCQTDFVFLKTNRQQTNLINIHSFFFRNQSVRSARVDQVQEIQG